MENKDYIHTGLGNKVQDYYTDINYSPPAGLQRTNCIFETSRPYDLSFRGYNCWMLPITTFELNEIQIDSKYKLMEALQKTTSITKVIDDHPYRPNFTHQTFWVLTENQKQSRKQSTSLLYKESTNNILRMAKNQSTDVSPYFLPRPNQINKIKANLKKM